MSRARRTTRWTNWELARLRLSYPVMTRLELAAAFPRHPIGSINSTAHALGLHKVFGNRKWQKIAARWVPTLRLDQPATIAFLPPVPPPDRPLDGGCISPCVASAVALSSSATPAPRTSDGGRAPSGAAPAVTLEMQP